MTLISLAVCAVLNVTALLIRQHARSALNTAKIMITFTNHQSGEKNVAIADRKSRGTGDRRLIVRDERRNEMLTGIRAQILAGYTGHDHLIDSGDEAAVMDAVAGQQFRRASDAASAARKAYYSSCDRRVAAAPISVELRNAYGDIVSVRG